MAILCRSAEKESISFLLREGTMQYADWAAICEVLGTVPNKTWDIVVTVGDESSVDIISLRRTGFRYPEEWEGLCKRLRQNPAKCFAVDVAVGSRYIFPPGQ